MRRGAAAAPAFFPRRVLASGCRMEGVYHDRRLDKCEQCSYFDEYE
jgi:hypothetical protein